MSDNKLEKRGPSPIKEKGQYLLAFGVVASMLIVAGFPSFVVLFFGVFAFLLFKMFATGSRSDTREIFEFYLSANEILRDDDRRWFGFEVKEAIQRGEAVVGRMPDAPPLVRFALGALYHKAGDHAAAVNNLAQVVENDKADESAYVFPSQDLRNYVRVLRKIEREPADAPLTSAAVRALERSRKIRGRTLLDESRALVAAQPKPQPQPQLPKPAETSPRPSGPPAPKPLFAEVGGNGNGQQSESAEKPVSPPPKRSKRSPEDAFADRKPISEVLHDIYDRNIQ